MDSPLGQRLAWRLRNSSTELHAPSVCDLELASFVRRELRRNALSELEAGDLIARYLALPIHLHDHRPLLVRILELRDALTAYDACYVALAERLGAALATTDGPLAAVARTLGVEVVD